MGTCASQPVAPALQQQAMMLKAAQDASGTRAANPLLFPMYVVPLDYFMSMTNYVATQEAAHDGSVPLEGIQFYVPCT